MGCIDSSQMRPDEPIDVTDMDFTIPATRKVEDYPFYNKRLREIDWRAEAAKNTYFCDPYWPADRRCILDETMEHPKSKWQTFVWKRPSEVYGRGNYVLFDKIDPGDIKQGNCGDCYFLSSISSLAERPERIRKIFLQDEINEAGCYAV